MALAEARVRWPSGGCGVDRGEGKVVAGGEQVADVGEVQAGPADGFEDFRDADAAVAIAVNKGEGLFVEFEAFYWAGKGDPEFLVEGGEGAQVGGVFDEDLIKTTEADEFPRVFGGREGRAHER